MTIYKIKVNYKSGISESFWCEHFEYEAGEFKWRANFHEGTIKPFLLGPNNIESVWYIDHKEIPDKEIADE